MRAKFRCSSLIFAVTLASWTLPCLAFASVDKASRYSENGKANEGSFGLELVLRQGEGPALEKISYSIKRLDGSPQDKAAAEGNGLLPSGLYEIEVEAEGHQSSRAYFIALSRRNSELEVRSEGEGRLRVRQILDFPQPAFVKGKAALSREALPILDEVFEFLKTVPEVSSLEIAVHTDKGGQESKNLKLTKDRADEISAYLVKRGFPQERLSPVGYGSALPLLTYDQPDAKFANRRSEFIIKSLALPLDPSSGLVGR